MSHKNGIAGYLYNTFGYLLKFRSIGHHIIANTC